MIEAGEPSTSEFQECYPKSCARPTGGSHGRTTDDPAQRFSRAKAKGRAKGRAKEGKSGKPGAAKGHYESRGPVGSGQSEGRAA
jgi:hypothetical protein